MIERLGWCSSEALSGPATMPYETISPRGFTPRASAARLDMTTTAEPPSEIWLAFAAVMVPSLSKAGFNPPRVSMVVSARTPSSFVTINGSPLRWGTATGTISSARRPAAIAAAAR